MRHVQVGETLDGGNGADRLEVAGGVDLSSENAISNFETLQLDGDVTLGTYQLGAFAHLTTQYSGTYNLRAGAAGSYTLAGKTVAGNIHFIGSGGNDTITGSSASDWLNGASGTDTLDGGLGDDVLNFTKGEIAFDIINNFQSAAAAGGDILQLSGYSNAAKLQSDGGSAYSVIDGSSVEHLQIHANALLTSQDYRFV